MKIADLAQATRASVSLADYGFEFNTEFRQPGYLIEVLDRENEIAAHMLWRFFDYMLGVYCGVYDYVGHEDNLELANRFMDVDLLDKKYGKDDGDLPLAFHIKVRISTDDAMGTDTPIGTIKALFRSFIEIEARNLRDGVYD